MRNFYVNPNVDKSVKATDNLNHLSKMLRSTKMSIIKSEGFELALNDFKWEYHIQFNTNNAFVVFREYGNQLNAWLYRFDNDLDPYQFIVNDANKDKNGKMFIQLVRNMYKMIKYQPKAVVEPEIELDSYDTLHSDGSKTYQTYNERILIDNPKTVLFLESVLAGEYVGWGYMEKVTDEYKSGRITQDEYSKIVKILD